MQARTQDGDDEEDLETHGSKAVACVAKWQERYMPDRPFHIDEIAQHLKESAPVAAFALVINGWRKETRRTQVAGRWVLKTCWLPPGASQPIGVKRDCGWQPETHSIG